MADALGRSYGTHPPRGLASDHAQSTQEPGTMIWIFVICLGALTYVSVAQQTPRDPQALRRCWSICCCYTAVLAAGKLAELAMGGMILVVSIHLRDLACWGLLVALLLSMRASLAPPP